MKKLILFLLTLSSLYAADAKIYMGLAYGLYGENMSRQGYNDNNNSTPDLSTKEISNISNSAIFKLGYGVREAYSIEFSLEYIANNSEIFEGGDAAKYGLNVDFIKAFDFDIYVLPYAKVGIGAGVLDTNVTESGKLSFGSFNAGLGMYIPISEHFDFDIGYQYRYVSYEKYRDQPSDNNAPQIPIEKSHTNMLYFGINTRF